MGNQNSWSSLKTDISQNISTDVFLSVGAGAIASILVIKACIEEGNLQVRAGRMGRIDQSLRLSGVIFCGLFVSALCGFLTKKLGGSSINGRGFGLAIGVQLPFAGRLKRLF